MAPLTRSRASQPGNVPNAMNATYYKQRSSAALIISEATQISQQGQGYAWTPGIHTSEQIAGWKSIADAVHESGGRIFLQLWHVGRVSHPMFQPDGGLPVAPSALPVPGKTFIVDSSGAGTWGDIPVPQALGEEGIASIVRDYATAARNSMIAGMDGVEIHAGNGYLLDQFINSNSNHRSDRYGGSSEKRARLLLEVTDAVCEAVGPAKVGVRLTPMGRFMGMGDDNPKATFGYIAEALNERGLAYLHLVEPSVVGNTVEQHHDPEWDEIMFLLRQKFHGRVIVAGNYTLETAHAALNDGRADLVAFGRPFIANPDLPLRLSKKAPLNEPDGSTFFGGGAKGYIDYPALPEEAI
ncbi:alkene reductase [Ensifer adhaerens]